MMHTFMIRNATANQLLNKRLCVALSYDPSEMLSTQDARVHIILAA